MVRALAAIAVATLLAWSPARAEPAAAPTARHVVDAPTAWLAPARQLHVDLGASHRGEPSATIGFGLGGLADLEVALTDRLIACPGCGATRAERDLAAATARFKVGWATAPTRPWRLGAALAFGRTIATRHAQVGGRAAMGESAQLQLVVGLRWRGAEAHVGGELWAARHGAAELAPAGARALRPLLALSWTPPPYPRTTMLVDVSWSPVVEDPGPRLGWVLGWGVRYQALRWGAIELVVRQRQDEALGDATVLVRVSGALALGERLGVGLH